MHTRKKPGSKNIISISEASSMEAEDEVREEIANVLRHEASSEDCLLLTSDHKNYEESRVRLLLHLYNKWVKAHRLRPRDSKFAHYVVYNMVKLCYSSQTLDSNLVSDVLLCIFNSKKDQDGIFANPFNYRPGWLTFWEWNKSMVRSESDALEYNTVFYFLSHANHARLTFEGFRFVDLGIFRPAGIPPAKSAALNNQPNLLLLLLRYGALQSPRERKNPQWYAPILHQLMLRIFWLLPRGTSEKSEVLFPVIKAKIWAELSIFCVQLLLRVIPQLQPNILKFRCSTVSGGSKKSEADLMTELEKDEQLDFLKRRHHTPSELQHLCRCAIRKCLWHNWMLPDGIAHLPLPQYFQRYLDLYEN